MRQTRVSATTRGPAACVPQGAEAPLRAVVQAHANCCFLDTDGVTRAAPRMLHIMDGWRPHRTDQEAGVRRNGAFDPNLRVVLVADTQICYPEAVSHPGQPALLFTIVADAVV